jgi:hypothetical protein
MSIGPRSEVRGQHSMSTGIKYKLTRKLVLEQKEFVIMILLFCDYLQIINL